MLPFAYYLHTPWTNQFLGHENSKQLQVTTVKITESKENKSIHKLDLSGSTGPGRTAAPPYPPPLATALALIRTFLHFNCRLQVSTTHDTTGLITAFLQVNCSFQVSTTHDTTTLIRTFLHVNCKQQVYTTQDTTALEYFYTLTVDFRYPLPMILQN